MGRSFKLQETGVCAWKSISVWLHIQISPGNLKENRDPSNELVYAQLKKFMFKKMLVNFIPTESFNATIRTGEKDNKSILKGHVAAQYLKDELARKINK